MLTIGPATTVTHAHPGRTDANGGHYVRTSGWGYPVGSYHYHANPRSGSQPTSSSDGIGTLMTIFLALYMLLLPLCAWVASRNDQPWWHGLLAGLFMTPFTYLFIVLIAKLRARWFEQNH
jgi:hypothetical protein